MRKYYNAIICAFFFISSSVYAEEFIKVGQTKIVKVATDIDAVAVGKSSVLDYQVIDDNTILLMAKEEGESFVTITDKNGKNIYNSDFIISARDISSIQEKINNIDRGSNIKITKNGDEYLATGNASSDEKIIEICDFLKKTLTKNYKNEYKVSTGSTGEDGTEVKYNDDPLSTDSLKCVINSQNQGKSLINVKIKIISVDKSVTNELGIQWQDILSNTGHYRLGHGFSDISGIISALTKTSGSKVLSEPNITVLPGEQAGFNSGGELPIITVTQGGDPSVSFKKYGISLNVLANFNSDNKIRVFMATELSSLDETNTYKRTDGSIMPALKSQSANTIVNIKDGDSFIIGGLTSEEKDISDEGISFLSKIPIIGGLFKTSDDGFKSKEILIVATVNKVDAKPTIVPHTNDGFIPLLYRHFNISPDKNISNAGPDLD